MAQANRSLKLTERALSQCVVDTARLPQTRPIRFRVPGPPVPKARARVYPTARGARGVTPRSTVEYAREVAIEFHRAAAGRIANLSGESTHPIRLTMRFRCGRVGDWDNFGKAVSDALNRWAYLDDKYVVEAHVYLERVGPRDEKWAEIELEALS